MKLREPPKIEDAIGSEAPITREDVVARVRRFALLRAAQRALAPSAAAGDSAIIRGMRQRLGALTALTEPDEHEHLGESMLADEVRVVDDTLDGYARSLLDQLQKIPLAQLRASLSVETHPQRVEVAALLELCLEAEPAPARFFRVVDFLVTLLAAEKRDGRWVVGIDPANLNDTLRARCAESGHVDTAVEARIAGRFQEAADCVASSGGEAVMDGISAYKLEVAGFYFNPAILRCIVGYNVAARNHFDARMERGREADSAIDDELGLFAPLVDQDPRAAQPGRELLPPHESPGVIAVREALRRRLQQAELTEGPAERIAACLDLDWLEREEREALQEPDAPGIGRIVRMAVVLGHLAMSLPDFEKDFAALGLRVAQLDTWICALSDEVQTQIDSLIRENEYEGAMRLGDLKSRYLSAVQVVARRRLGRGASQGEADSLERDAVDLVRDHLEERKRPQDLPVFFDLLGGGWKRTVALLALLLPLASLAIVESLPDSHPRRIRELEHWQARDISTLLGSAYRDHAGERSIFVGTLTARWHGLTPTSQRKHADVIRAKAFERGAVEVLLFDEDRVLQARYADGRWRTAGGWETDGRSSGSGGSGSFGPRRHR